MCQSDPELILKDIKDWSSKNSRRTALMDYEEKCRNGEYSDIDGPERGIICPDEINRKYMCLCDDFNKITRELCRECWEQEAIDE